MTDPGPASPPAAPVDDQLPTATGLTRLQAEQRLAADGYNEVLAVRQDRLLTILRKQLTDTVIVVLLVAAVLTAIIRDWPDTTVILAVIVLNTALGAAQQVRSNRALDALADLTAPHARVVRDGIARDVEARQVVRGDLVLLAAGDIVAADGTVLAAESLQLNEAVLTGESVPVAKPVGDQVLAGTVVTRGHAQLQVTEVGQHTAMGLITRSVTDARRVPTPVQAQLTVLGRRLAGAVSVAAVLVGALNLLAGHGLETSAVLAISLAVAAIPESLPAVVAMSLALAANRMARRGVLARELAAVEALGSVTVIASDKTGTLTEGRMTVAGSWTPQGTAAAGLELLRAAALCSDAFPAGGLRPAERDDPIEIALVEAARAAGIEVGTLRADWPRISERPFQAETARMTTSHRGPDGRLLIVTKGAPEPLLAELGTSPSAAAALATLHRYTEGGLRALAVVSGEGESAALLGLIAFRDPVRAAAPAMVQAFAAAGVRTVMITGDHPDTAWAVARELGLVTASETATGSQEAVYARVRPERKTEIVLELRQRGEVVAMAGDGVNDAPALRAADIGIAMGRGTEVAKQSAALVLTSDDLSAMIPAIAEGRRVYDNLRRFLHYALSGGVAEVLIMLFGPLFGLSIPLQAGQILWVNLLTHGLPGVAMGTEPAAEDVLRRPPRPPGQRLLDVPAARRIGLLASVIAASTLLAGGWSALSGRPAQSTVFLTLTFAQLAAGLALRPRGAARDGNRMLTGAVALNVLLALLAVWWWPLRELLRTQPISALDLVPACLAAAAAAIVARRQVGRAGPSTLVAGNAP